MIYFAQFSLLLLLFQVSVTFCKLWHRVMYSVLAFFGSGFENFLTLKAQYIWKHGNAMFVDVFMTFLVCVLLDNVSVGLP